ncbi:MAG: MgtC/SapB family protein [Candidatus Hydrothermarchaeales archaeon]
MISSVDFVKMVIISALVGGLIGVERQQKVRVLAGTRTFALTAMLGTFSVLIATIFEIPTFISASFIGIAFVGVLIGYVKNVQLDDIGITTVVAFLIAYLLGVLVGKGLYVEALAGSVIVTVILVSKYTLQEFTEGLTHEELINALEFGIIAFVLYPIVPNRAIDPYGLINPRILVLIIIVVSSIGFVGFLALRKVGIEKGLAVTGFLGASVSSLATASSLSIKVRGDNRLLNPAIQGIILADVVMLLRNLVIAGIVSLAVLKMMLIPQIAMVVIALAYFYFKGRTNELKEETPLPLESPFAIYPAIRFGVMITIVSVVVKLVQNLGVGGIYFASIIGGLVSSSAVTASLVSLYSTGSLDLTTAAVGSVIASIGSILTKLWISKASGTDDLTRSLTPPTIVLTVVGSILLIVLFVL